MKRIYVAACFLIAALGIAALIAPQGAGGEYDGGAVDSMVDDAITAPTSAHIRALLGYPESHLVDGEYASHYIASL